MPVSDVIAVTVSIELRAQIANGFGVPMILGNHTRFAERFRIYASPSAMLVDGFLAADPEYIAAQRLTSQDRRAPLFVVGRRAAPVARVVNVTVTSAVDGATYAIEVDDGSAAIAIAVSIVADPASTVSTIRDQLVAQANIVLGNVTAAPGAAGVFSLTADTAGRSFAVTESDARITFVEVTPNTGAAEDLEAIDAAGALWYGGMLTSRAAGDQLEAATWVASSELPHLMIFQTNDALSVGNAYDSADIDMAARLKALANGRAAAWWHHSNSEYLDAAVMGSRIPRDAGTETWHTVRLSGVTASPVSSLSATGRSNLATRNASFYYEIAPGISVTSGGKVGSGQWIDQVRLGDAIAADVAEGVLNVYLTNPKVPMTDDGITWIANVLRGTWKKYIATGAIDGTPKPTVIQPSEDDISAEDRAARFLNPPITGEGRSTGAIHSAGIEVTITQ